jgi:hypothetical protein
MKITLRLLLLALLSLSFAACQFKEPVFTDGFAKMDPSLGGVWATEGDAGDPRKMEFAVCAPLDEARYLLHHPSGGNDGIYYEARPVVIREHTLLQLRVLATFTGGLPKPDAERFTLLWIEKEADGKTLRVRSLSGDGVKGKRAADVRKELETPASYWTKLFGDAAVFHRLKDE